MVTVKDVESLLEPLLSAYVDMIDEMVDAGDRTPNPKAADNYNRLHAEVVNRIIEWSEGIS